MLDQTKRKRNHWVPQAYLRAFAADPARRKIWRLSKTAGDPELKPIKKVAVRHYLYAPNGPQGRDYGFETKLSSLEQLFGHYGWSQISTGAFDLRDTELRKGIALLAAVMYLRNPLRLEMTRALHKKMVEHYSQLKELPEEVSIGGKTYKVDLSDWPAYREADEDSLKRMWLKQVGSAAWLAEIMMKMRWAIQYSDRPLFITTDNPVVVLHPDLGAHGFKSPDAMVLFPLSPTRLLMMDNRHFEPDGQYYPVGDGGTGGVNGLLWRESIDHLFSSRHPNAVMFEMCLEAERRGFDCGLRQAGL